MNVNIYSDEDELNFLSNCFKCKHKYINSEGCLAFKRIPVDILLGEFDHTKKRPDQKNDIVFEPIDKKDK